MYGSRRYHRCGHVVVDALPASTHGLLIDAAGSLILLVGLRRYLRSRSDQALEFANSHYRGNTGRLLKLENR